MLVELEQMRKERDDTLLQVEPLSKQVEELKEEREISEALGERRREMMRDLVKRAQRICGCFGGDHLGIPHAFQPGVASSHIYFFTQLVENLEKVCSDVDMVVEGECRDLLAHGRQADLLRPVAALRHRRALPGELQS